MMYLNVKPNETRVIDIETPKGAQMIHWSIAYGTMTLIPTESCLSATISNVESSGLIVITYVVTEGGRSSLVGDYIIVERCTELTIKHS